MQVPSASGFSVPANVSLPRAFVFSFILVKHSRRTGQTEGIALGIAAGNVILALRANDGAYQNPVVTDWPSSTVPGVYVKVPPFDFDMLLFGGKSHHFHCKHQNSSVLPIRLP